MTRNWFTVFALTFAVVVAIGLAGCGDESPSSPTSPTGTGSGSTSSQTDASLTAPTARSPAVGEPVKDLQPELEIDNATGGSGTRTYTFELSLDSAFQQMAVTETDIQEGLGGITKWRVPEPLMAEAKYFWRVRASTSAGVGPYSDPAEFRIREAFSSDRPTGDLVVFDPLTSGSSVGMVMGGRFVDGGWQALSNADCLRYQVPTLDKGLIEFQTTNVNSPNPVPGKRMLISMWDPTKGDYTTNPFRMHLQKLDRATVGRWPTIENMQAKITIANKKLAIGPAATTAVRCHSGL